MTDRRHDDEFYARDRPARPTLPEDRPRGAKPKAPARHRGPWVTVAIVVAVVVLVALGAALFP